MKSKIFILLIFFLTGCADDFLDVKKDSSMVVPNKIEDFIGLMDNSLMYTGMSTELGTYGADEFTVPDGQLFSLTVPLQRNAYIWADDVYERQAVSDWDLSYQRVLYCNMAIEGLEKLKDKQDRADWKNAMGMALFFRALNFFFLQQEFGQIYDVKIANTALGIPLRLQSDVTLVSKRASVEETYRQILDDLNAALSLLPDMPLVKQRPSRQAVYGLLARVYLILEDYRQTLSNAKMCIDLGGQLLDYAEIDGSKAAPFPSDVSENTEIILYTTMQPSTLLRTRYSVSQGLLDLFSENDYRRQLYFQYNPDGRVLFRGSYMGATGSNFTGLALDEIYLIRVECLLRLGAWEEANSILKYYLGKRYGSNELTDYPTDREELLSYVILERRRQLIFRGTRWMDLRRLNKDSRFAKSLKKEIDGKVYVLESGSNQYTWPIPNNAVEFGGLEQNKR